MNREDNWLRNNLPKKERQRIERAVSLIAGSGDPAAMHLQLVDAGKDERQRQAKLACEQRRLRRESGTKGRPKPASGRGPR